MNKDLLEKFYKGECTPGEVQIVLQWFQANTLQPPQEQELDALWHKPGLDGTGGPRTHNSAGRVFGKIKEQLQEYPDTGQEKTGATIRSLAQQQPVFWLKVAAVLLPLCLVWALVQYTAGLRATDAVYMSVEAAPGIKKTVTLVDGSTIKLNSGSSISFQKNFAGNKREITLRGEAFFQVAKDSLRPFIVHTGKISTQALGTSFNIKYNSYEDNVAVSLATGVVKIDKKEQEQARQLARLKPGQQLAYHKQTQHYTVAAFNSDEVLSWQEGVLNFKDAGLEAVVRKLEHWYGVDIEVESSNMPAKDWNYTGAYDNESLDKVLEGIGFVKSFSYKRTNKKVKVMFNKS